MTSNEMMSIGTKVRTARREAKMSPEELAVALGVSSATMFRIERDATDVTVQRLALIAEATGRPMSYFLNGEAA